MKILAVLAGIIAFFCLAIGVVTLLGVLPLLRAELTGTVWFELSALLFLASIACKSSGRGGGGGEY